MRKSFFLFLLILIPAFCFAQAFGFDDYDDEKEKTSFLPFSLEISGEVEAGPLLVHDFKGGKSSESFSMWDMLEAGLNFEVNSKHAVFFAGLYFSSSSIDELRNGEVDNVYTPLIIDELYLGGFFDRLKVYAGFKKLRWGKMFSSGPLDVINPLDYSDLTSLTEVQEMKIARPMLHFSLEVADTSTVEAVFIPNFAPHRFSRNGRWVPDEYTNVASVYAAGILNRAIQRYPAFAPIISGAFSEMSGGFSSDDYPFPGTTTPDFFQAGLRFNTTLGPCDFGFQYFYGNSFLPSVSMNGVDDFINDLVSKFPSLTPDFDLLSPHIEYSRYHQIGVDYSQVVYGFGLRAEVAANITGDLSGGDGNVKNPFLAWSLGFDRDIFAGINVNVQCNETIRLLNDKVGINPAMDCEAGTDVTSTRLIIRISKNFFRDKLECKVVNVWDIEDSGLAIVPSVAWVLDDTRVELSSGIFTGDEKSEFGQYWQNSYIKLKVSYSF